jgi:hypothetical protein
MMAVAAMSGAKLTATAHNMNGRGIVVLPLWRTEISVNYDRLDCAIAKVAGKIELRKRFRWTRSMAVSSATH